MISDDAVDAAAKAYFEASVAPWRMAAREEKVIFRRRARAALEAAAPYIQADALEDAAGDIAEGQRPGFLSAWLRSRATAIRTNKPN